jgi:hypothetical protein
MKFLGTALFLSACMLAAQAPQSPQPTATPAASSAATPADNNIDPTQLAALVKKQFGDTFKIPEKFSTPMIIADFNGDGILDIAIVANSKEPFPDSYNFKYQVGDPYHAYFGFGNPQMTSAFSADPAHTHDLLVIFGDGPDAWRAATPQAKFVLINVPFDSIAVGRMLISKKKPPIFVIKALESEIMDSAVYWEAKKKRWRWEPGDTVQ